MSAMELDLASARASFDRAAASYDEHAVLQHEVEQRLLERLEYLRQEPARVLDLGCGTGIASQALKQSFPSALVVGLDWSAGMLNQLQGRASAGEPPRPVCADMQTLPFAPRSFDLVFSNLALQWSPDLPAVFGGVRRVLGPGGMFVFTTFGPDTLAELRSAWAQVDRLPHVHEFRDMHDIGDMMMAAGFAEPVMDMEMFTLEYRDVRTLMRELKAIGAHNAAASRNSGLTGKDAFRDFVTAYERFRRDGRLPASYEVVYGAAFGPAEGQPVRTPAGETAVFSVDALRRRTAK
jgi:malonyl-CoA O-methyltransferase